MSYVEKLNDLKEHLNNKSKSDYQMSQLRTEMISIKEQLQKQFLKLFDDIYSSIRGSVITLQFNRDISYDDYYGDLSAEYEIGNFKIRIDFESLEHELMQATLNIDNDIDEVGDEFEYELTKTNGQWLWMSGNKVLDGELLLDDIMSVMKY